MSENTLYFFLVLLGFAGLAFRVDYAGWILLVGLLGVVFG